MFASLSRCTRWLALIAILAAPALPAAEPAATTVSVPSAADFFRAPRLSNPTLSPSGRHLAAAVAGDDGRLKLGVLDLENLGQAAVAAAFTDGDVTSIRWVNEQRLVFSSQTASDLPSAPGLWAVNRDGSELRQLVLARGRPASSVLASRVLPWQWRLNRTLRDGSADVLIERVQYSGAGQPLGLSLARLDTRTGISTNLSLGAPDYVGQWLSDEIGRPFAVLGQNRGEQFSELRSGDGRWQRWQTGPARTGEQPIPFWGSSDGFLLALAPSAKGRLALFEVDRQTLKPDPEPLISLGDYDFDGRVVYDPQSRRLLGVHFEADAKGSVWFDPAMRALQTEVDAVLPATINRIECTNCLSAPRVLVIAASDRQSPVVYLYQRADRQLIRVAESRPWIKPQQMARREVHRFAARDGLPIPVLVTRPLGPVQARPAVLLAHGGPWVRGTHWEWEQSAQFLASRGYVVIEPEFRGSRGYGFTHYQASWKQWGLAMQDDLEDAVRWAAQQGWIDPARVCIAGASYGGYATLMGLVRHPETYRCGIAWASVTDIDLLYSITWSDASEDWKGYGMPLLVGDREKDAEQLAHTSPLKQAAKIRRPLLLAHGAADVRVPLQHGSAMRSSSIRPISSGWCIRARATVGVGSRPSSISGAAPSDFWRGTWGNKGDAWAN